MTEKRYQMRNTNLADENGRSYYNIQREDGINICQVYGKNNAKSLIDELNELHEQSKENDRIANDLLESKEQLEDDTSIIMLMELKKENNGLKAENEQLKQHIIHFIQNGLCELFGEKYRIIEDIGDLND